MTEDWYTIIQFANNVIILKDFPDHLIDYAIILNLTHFWNLYIHTMIKVKMQIRISAFHYLTLSYLVKILWNQAQPVPGISKVLTYPDSGSLFY